MIYNFQKDECCEFDERTGGWTDYNDFRVYDKLTNTVYETKNIASKATGISYNKIQNDINSSTKRWNRIGRAFRDRKYNYYKCEENFLPQHKGKKVED